MKFFFADTLLPTSNSTDPTDTETVHNVPTLDAGTVVHNGLDIMFYLLGAIAVIIIIVSGIMYVTSAGNSANVTRAKNALTYSIVGLIVVILAFAITQFIAGRFS
jgi:hypothetical protein